MGAEEWVEQVRAGKAEAWDTIYEAYAPMVRNVCCNITRKDEDSVNDLVQDVFVLAFHSLDQLRDPAKLGEWMCVIARNVSLKYLDKKQKEGAVSLSEISEEDWGEQAVCDTEALLNEKDLWEVIEKLPKGYREVFHLYAVEGYSHQEIAERLGIEAHSSSSQLARAKALLRKLVSRRTLAFLAVSLVGTSIYWLFERSIGRGGLPRVAERTMKERRSEVKGMKKKESAPASVAAGVETSWGVQPTIRMIEAAGLPFNQTLRLDSFERAVVYPDTLFWASSSLDEQRLVAEHEEERGTAVQEQPLPNGQQKAPLMEADKDEWLVGLMGTMGAEMAMNQPMLTEGNGNIGSDFPEPDEPGGATPPDVTSFETWQDYYRYLIQLDPNGMTDEEKAMLEIAKHNRGQIVEHEHHYQPITLGFSLGKHVGKKWSIGSGLKYSLLRSDFRIGEQGYAVYKKQRVHYLGIPLYASYRCVDAKRWTVYSSVGVELNVPLLGRFEERYVTGGKSSLEVERRVHAPVQWGVGANVGVQYKFTPHWGVYVEPSLHWQVPNGGGIRTSWTKEPWTFSVPLGIRYTW